MQSSDPRGVSETSYDEADLWARSGARDLTGRPDGPALPCAGAPASAVQRELDRIAAFGVRALAGVEILGARALAAGVRRNGPWSVGGSFRLLPTSDGRWVGLSLPRADDVAMVPALVEAPTSDDPWRAVEQWISSRPAAEVVERIALLGLAGAVVPERDAVPRREGVIRTPGGPRDVVAQPVVVDLSSLWAGPLCAWLLGASGATVIKVESRARPDGARFGPAEFYRWLHDGHESVLLDFTADRAELQRLVANADVVVEASRPRALRQLGISAEAEVARGAIWVSITAYGRGAATEHRIGFGDDVAAGAGLVAWESGVPLPAGDALADPLAGVTAGAAAIAAVRDPYGCLLDVSMHDVAVAARVDGQRPNRVDSSASASSR